MSTIRNTEIGAQTPEKQPCAGGISRDELPALVEMVALAAKRRRESADGALSKALSEIMVHGAGCYGNFLDELNGVLGATPSEVIPESAILELIERHARLARAERERAEGLRPSLQRRFFEHGCRCHEDCVNVLTKRLIRLPRDVSAVL